MCTARNDEGSGEPCAVDRVLKDVDLVRLEPGTSESTVQSIVATILLPLHKFNCTIGPVRLLVADKKEEEEKQALGKSRTIDVCVTRFLLH